MSGILRLSDEGHERMRLHALNIHNEAARLDVDIRNRAAIRLMQDDLRRLERDIQEALLLLTAEQWRAEHATPARSSS